MSINPLPLTGPENHGVCSGGCQQDPPIQRQNNWWSRLSEEQTRLSEETVGAAQAGVQ